MILAFPKHKRAPCTDPDCDGRCVLCNLFICSVCCGAEGSLPTDCPGVQMSMLLSDEVYAGRLDYKVKYGWIQSSRWNRAR